MLYRFDSVNLNIIRYPIITTEYRIKLEQSKINFGKKVSNRKLMKQKREDKRPS